MNGKTFRADKTHDKLQTNSIVVYLFVGVLAILTLLQLFTNIGLVNRANDANSAATFFAESVEQMCATGGEANNFRGLCREAEEYSQGLRSTYDIAIDSREVDSIKCMDDGSVITYKNGETFESDRRCGEGPLFGPAP